MMLGRLRDSVLTRVRRAIQVRHALALAPLAEVVVEDRGAAAAERSVRVRLRAYAAPVVNGNDAALRRAVGDLVDGAIAAARPGTTVLVQVESDGRRALVDIVADVPPQPRATPRTDRAARIARTHGGEVVVVEERGGHVRLELPCLPSPD